MSGPILKGDIIPENLPDKTKKWLKENKPLWKTSPFDIPGPEYRSGLDSLADLINEKRKAWGIERQEILVGFGDAPPSDPNCLVYLDLSISGQCFEEFFRKELKPGGRWVNKSYMHHVNGSPDQKGTFDYDYEIAYI